MNNILNTIDTILKRKNNITEQMNLNNDYNYDLPQDFNTYFDPKQSVLCMFGKDLNKIVIDNLIIQLKNINKDEITILSISSGNTRTEALLLKFIHNDTILQNKKINMILFDPLYNNYEYVEKIFHLNDYEFKPNYLSCHHDITELINDEHFNKIDIIIGINVQLTKSHTQFLEKLNKAIPVYFYMRTGGSDDKVLRWEKYKNVQEYIDKLSLITFMPKI